MNQPALFQLGRIAVAFHGRVNIPALARRDFHIHTADQIDDIDHIGHVNEHIFFNVRPEAFVHRRHGQLRTAVYVQGVNLAGISLSRRLHPGIAHDARHFDLRFIGVERENHDRIGTVVSFRASRVPAHQQNILPLRSRILGQAQRREHQQRRKQNRNRFFHLFSPFLHSKINPPSVSRRA